MGDEYKVRLRCCHGTYLRDNPLDFLGEPEANGVDFKMLVCGDFETQATIVALISSNGQFHGTYALKWAWDPMWARRQWLRAEAQAVADNDPVFSGKRCHPKDT